MWITQEQTVGGVQTVGCWVQKGVLVLWICRTCLPFISLIMLTKPIWILSLMPVSPYTLWMWVISKQPSRFLSYTQDRDNHLGRSSIQNQAPNHSERSTQVRDARSKKRAVPQSCRGLGLFIVREETQCSFSERHTPCLCQEWIWVGERTATLFIYKSGL